MKKWKTYPTAVAHRSGCKVSWNYYRTEAEAKECSDAAAFNARIALSEGYDFGYCAPGSICQMKDGASIKNGWGADAKVIDVSGLYEVCLP